MLCRLPFSRWREGGDLRFLGELSEGVPQTPTLTVTVGGCEGQEGHRLLHGWAVILPQMKIQEHPYFV